jgi:hypothetical protein
MPKGFQPPMRKGMQPLGDILKQDVFNLDGLVGLMAVKQAITLWLAAQPNGHQVRIIAVKPLASGCRVKLAVPHSTQLQQWQPQWQHLQAHLNSIAPQTNWPVIAITCSVC